MKEICQRGSVGLNRKRCKTNENKATSPKYVLHILQRCSSGQIGVFCSPIVTPGP